VLKINAKGFDLGILKGGNPVLEKYTLFSLR
jgi:hypothetical protein